MACGLVKRFLFIFVLAALLCATVSGCETEKSPLPSVGETVFATPAPSVYDTFESGIGNYSFNAMLFIEKAMDTLKRSSYIANMSEQQSSYYNELLLMSKMLKLDLSVLSEIDMLDTDGDYEDRADGKLIVSGYDGYKIFQRTGIKFGYTSDESVSQNMVGTLLFDKKYMSVQISETLSDNVSAQTVAEFVMIGDEGIVARYSKNVNNNGQITSKVMYVISNEKSCEIAYYEGNGDTSKMISLDKLTNYSVNSISFGVGTVISFDMEK